MIILSTYRGPGDYPQLNAVRSWQIAFPHASIWLFYTEDEPPGTMAALRDLKHVFLCHLEPRDCTPAGTPLLNRMFELGRETMAEMERAIVWVNADIILDPQAWDAIAPAVWHDSPFFLTGQRWDVDVNRFLTEEELSDRGYLKELAKTGRLLGPHGADWFAFDRRLFHDLPPFAIGRCTFDQAMIWHAIQTDVPHRFDLTEHVLALHQTHTESSQSRLNEEAQENVRIMKEWHGNWTVGWDGWVNQLPAPTRIDRWIQPEAQV